MDREFQCMSQQPIQLIVGLGNPGTKYEKTRHNAGTWFVEELAAKAACTLRVEPKFQGRYASSPQLNCRLLIPTTFMNNSGRSLRALTQFYSIPPEAILVVHDEIDLPLGLVRLKFDGGAGGHNGLKDIIEQLGAKHFHRLRIGVGHPGHSDAVADYVLNAPSKAERQLIDAALARAQAVLPLILQGEMQKAMQHLHSESI